MLSSRSGRVKAARRLRQRQQRAELGLFLAEGTKALTEALHPQVGGLQVGAASGVVEVFATEEASEEYAALRKAVDAAGLPWHLAEESAVASLSGARTPQGVVAVCRVLDVPLDQVLDAEHGPLVICADVRDPGNAGTVIRTADAAGASGVVLAGHSVDAYNDKTVRATVGSLWHLPLALHDDPADAVRRAQAAGLTVLATCGDGEVDLFEADALLDQPHAWLLGNEAWGLPDELAAMADHRIAIPLFDREGRGRAESLNLATAAAVCLYASARQRTSSGPASGPAST